jgi:hypothetical protein
MAFAIGLTAGLSAGRFCGFLAIAGAFRRDLRYDSVGEKIKSDVRQREGTLRREGTEPCQVNVGCWGMFPFCIFSDMPKSEYVCYR